MALSDALRRIVAFLRAGSPGVPEDDYIPLLALLRRRLSDDEVVSVAIRLGSVSGLFRDVKPAQVKSCEMGRMSLRNRAYKSARGR